MARYTNPFPQYLDKNANPLSFGTVDFFMTGTNDKQDTFSDSALLNKNSNPVILDGEGRLPNVFLSGVYKVRIRSKDGVQIEETDPVGIVAGSDVAFSEWVLTTIYGINSIVEASNGKFYVSITTPNEGNDPTSSPSNWKEVRFIELYNPNINYDVGIVVQTDNGSLHKSVNNPNTNNDPNTDDGTNWQVAVDESKFLNIVTDNITVNTLATIEGLSVTANTTTDTLNVTNTSTLNDVNAQDVDSVLLKRAGINVYSRTDIVGTVTESGGIPTGSIIESGSNANGNFIKYADGTMVCDMPYFSVPSGGAVWTFPIVFVGSFPAITHGITLSGGVATGTPLMSETHGPSLTKVIALIYDVAGVFAGTEEVTLTARGRWF